ncbi:YkgJ family cysteine cluster protein [Jannaschia seohaensis]|uniref:Putative zinc-or iron-chelating protein n=1 Tax=Jannaschia seohaensis TaxID=475081 RepID=A0A2Y9A5G2_9RHOB|nr:YkgJ family cysteine cluster protein [Jannaschia seohaensis]PWJ22400.1 putative zinc- or iron-chelating protein [Jannaschia seohaensis]SSA38678.1 Putative zinc- or iron-chelating domain-containing protein [Jannaschia seohaensis]
MPRSARAARRAARPSGVPTDRPTLRAALAAARLSGHPPAVTDQARGLLLAWFDASPEPFDALLRQLSDGTAASRIGEALLARSPAPEGLACASGCAFCCILSGEDGGTITRADAARLHAALPAGEDAEPWHPDACPALDPATRLCRAYEARPLICRTYVSRDVSACEAIAGGDARPGTGTLPAQVISITAHALVRAALGRGAPTYSLRKVAAGARAGRDLADTLSEARQSPRDLDAERRRLARPLRR